jgi:hypothetical protein
MTTRLLSLVGIIVILAVAFALSSNRRWIRPRVVGSAFVLQIGIAALVLYVPAGRDPDGQDDDARRSRRHQAADHRDGRRHGRGARG